MRFKTLHRAGKHERTFAIALDEDEDPIRTLLDFAAGHQLAGSSVTAIGGLSFAVLGFVNRSRGHHRRITVDVQTEILSLAGEIAHHDDKPMVHLSAVLGLADGTTRGGRLLEATVSPALEMIVTESPAHLRKTFDPKLELPLTMAEEMEEEGATLVPSPADELPTLIHDIHPARRV